MTESESDVFVHKGRKFRRISQSSPSLPRDDANSSPVPRYSLQAPPAIAAHPVPSRSLILPPPQPLSSKQSRPMSARGRPKPNAILASKLDPVNEYRMEFALQHSQPLPPISSQQSSPKPTIQSRPEHQSKLLEVDSAVDLDFTSQCGTPIDIPLSILRTLNSNSIITTSTTPNNSPKQALKETLKAREGTTSVQLGLKLPNSERIQHEFPLNATINDVIKYAEKESGIDLKDCIVSTNGLTRTALNDKQLTLNDSNITVRTVLYFSLP
ncbi:PREDICTED: probable serine/threonine-protein kinase samkC [Amphimedon queenslandica]|uniref:UBX domain-containing protein n=1 Tax=Amphimedon queenslandica TaxID=400682 RepID=A0A1X7UEK7_AMPQE|nr:PREDICTED: probable serine/threonine-protein kinase samkC [Amphimedon queenslandica]|eukprot:XP_019854851.1 PREDICTED: probable serine/threonine-protein kinase samkC [Amphimedon queenslandica]